MKACSRCRENLPLDNFYKQAAGRLGRSSLCKPCHRTFPSQTPESIRRRELKRRYGLTLERHRELLASQSGRCAICGRLMSEPHVDHDHATGKVRELLCVRCNVGLGYFEDAGSLLRAAAYLKKHAAAPLELGAGVGT